MYVLSAIKLYQQDHNKSSKIMKEMKTYYRRAEKLLWYKGKELSKAQNCDIYSYMQVVIVFFFIIFSVIYRML